MESRGGEKGARAQRTEKERKKQKKLKLKLKLKKGQDMEVADNRRREEWSDQQHNRGNKRETRSPGPYLYTAGPGTEEFQVER